MGQKRMHFHHKVIYQAVAQHILTQRISAVVVVSYFLVDRRNIRYAYKHQKMTHK
jgi:hypothetical protein